jgi:hypothetical protein
VPSYPLSPLDTYYIPDNGPLQSFKVGSGLQPCMSLRLAYRSSVRSQHLRLSLSRVVSLWQ